MPYRCFVCGHRCYDYVLKHASRRVAPYVGGMAYRSRKGAVALWADTQAGAKSFGDRRYAAKYAAKLAAAGIGDLVIVRILPKPHTTCVCQ